MDRRKVGRAPPRARLVRLQVVSLSRDRLSCPAHELPQPPTLSGAHTQHNISYMVCMILVCFQSAYLLIRCTGFYSTLSAQSKIGQSQIRQPRAGTVRREARRARGGRARRGEPWAMTQRDGPPAVVVYRRGCRRRRSDAGQWRAAGAGWCGVGPYSDPAACIPWPWPWSWGGASMLSLGWAWSRDVAVCLGA